MHILVMLLVMLLSVLLVMLLVMLLGPLGITRCSTPLLCPPAGWEHPAVLRMHAEDSLFGQQEEKSGWMFVANK